MRKIANIALGFAIACLLIGAFVRIAPAQQLGTNQAIRCTATAIYDASTSGSTQLVALTAGQTIYLCGYTIVAGGTVNVKLVYGTGSNCAGGPTNMTPAYQLVAQAGVNDASAFYRGLKTGISNALCINASGAVAVQAIVYYQKF